MLVGLVSVRQLDLCFRCDLEGLVVSLGGFIQQVYCGLNISIAHLEHRACGLRFCLLDGVFAMQLDVCHISYKCLTELFVLGSLWICRCRFNLCSKLLDAGVNPQ